jgi:hypothetical protein
MAIIEVLLAIANMWDSDTMIMKSVSMLYGTIGLWIFGAMLASSSSEVAYAQLSGATGALQQQQQQQQPPTLQSSSSSTTFESPEKGIRIQVPAGYVVEDPPQLVSSEEVDRFMELAGLSYTLPRFLLHVCPEELALPAIGGEHRCENPPGMVYGPREGSGTIGTADAIHVMRFDNLRDTPEFEGVLRENQNITTDDLIAFNISFLTQGRNVDISVVNTTDTTVNYYTQNGSSQVPTTTTLPAKFADLNYTISWDDGTSSGSMEYRGYFLHVLGPDGNSGYTVAYEQPSSEVIESAGGGEGGVVQQQQWISPAVAQVFDSFELVE